MTLNRPLIRVNIISLKLYDYVHKNILLTWRMYKIWPIIWGHIYICVKIKHPNTKTAISQKRDEYRWIIKFAHLFSITKKTVHKSNVFMLYTGRMPKDDKAITVDLEVLELRLYLSAINQSIDRSMILLANKINGIKQVNSTKQVHRLPEKHITVHQAGQPYSIPIKKKQWQRRRRRRRRRRKKRKDLLTACSNSWICE